MKKLLSLLMTLSLLTMASCGKNTSQPETQENSQISATQANSQILNDDEYTPAEVYQNDGQQSADSEHIRQMLEYLDKSWTASANSIAKCFSQAIATAMYDLNVKSGDYDGVYMSELPQELLEKALDYFQITDYEKYCVEINGNDVNCWVLVNASKSIEENKNNLENNPEEFMNEMSETFGYVDIDAWKQALSETNVIYYGSYPNTTVSQYNEVSENNSGYSYSEPDISNCSK